MWPVETLMPVECCSGIAEVQAVVDLDGDGHEEIIWDIAPRMTVMTMMTLWYRGEPHSMPIGG